jgi:exonuclease SbcC
MALEDGTVADGKVETYTRCVEAICGNADTFFTSVFSAQGKRQLSAYRNAEIKTLLADLLGQEEIRALGQKAAETARLLKIGLAAIWQEQSGLDDDAQRIGGELQRLEGAAGRIAQSLAARQAAQATLEAARSQHAQLVAERERSQSVELRRTQLQGECSTVIQAGTEAIEALKAQEQGESQRLARLEQRIAQRLSQERNRRQALHNQRQQCLKVLASAPTVRQAEARLPMAEQILSLRLARVVHWLQQTQRLTQCKASERLILQKLSGIEREAGQAALKAEELARRFGLAGVVPCAGTDLQGLCQLLVDAREAQALVPGAQAAIKRLADQKAAAQEELAVLGRQSGGIAAAPQKLAWTEQRAEVAGARNSRYALLAAKAGEQVRAKNALAEIEAELAALGDETSSCQQGGETPDESAEREQIGTARQAIATQHEQQAKHYRATLDRLKQVLAALPPCYDEQRLSESRRKMEDAAQSVATAEQNYLSTVRDAENFTVLTQQATALATRQAQVASRIAKVQSELGDWTLFAKCMSNDGLIALAIDDAGPALARLANDLLLASYGSRFTVSILTQVETAKGEQKEGFDIQVHDGDSGESKSVSLMSGGERVWINECLIRAVALYLCQNTGRRYGALFSDEADGALDPEHKRMFMAMKRAVLCLGGYQREFFVSQTPELTAMADAMIDLEVCAESSRSQQSA